MMSNTPVDLARQFFEALMKKDFSEFPLAAEVVLESPISPRLSGQEAVLEFLEGLASVTKSVRVVDVISEGDKVAVEFELETAEGVIPGFECFEVSNGRIKKLRPYFDSRPLLGGNA
jgi:ketosteroid isomerase-like protein